MFTYSPISTKLILTTKNKKDFKTWNGELYLLLLIYHLNNCIFEESIKKISIKNIIEDNISKSLKIHTIFNMLYFPNVTQEIFDFDYQV